MSNAPIYIGANYRKRGRSAPKDSWKRVDVFETIKITYSDTGSLVHLRNIDTGQESTFPLYEFNDKFERVLGHG